MKKLLSVLALLALASPGLAQTYDADGRQKVNVEAGAGQGVEAAEVPAAPTGVYFLLRNIEATPNEFIAPVGDAEGRMFMHVQNGVHENFEFSTLDFDTVGTDLRAATGILLPSATGGVIGGTATAPVRVDPTGTTPQPVTGTFYQATQPISIEQTGDNNAVDVLTLPTLATVTTVGTVTNLTNLPNENQQTAANSISVTPDTDNDAIGAAGAAPPGEVLDVGGRTSGADTTGLMTGLTICSEHYAVDIVTATTTLIVTGVANRHVRICSINLVTAAANNVALVAGTGATCATSTAGINGGVTAAEGWNLAANGGIAQGGGLGEIMSTKVSGGATGDSICIITSAATQLSGTLSVAIY